MVRDIQRLMKLGSQVSKDSFVQPSCLLEIKADSPHNVFVGRKLGVDDISIVNDVAGEEQAAPDRVDEVHGLVEGDDDPHKPGHACAQSELVATTIEVKQRTESDQTAEQPRAFSTLEVGEFQTKV